jgi:hypothetical protein
VSFGLRDIIYDDGSKTLTVHSNEDSYKTADQIRMILDKW